MKSNLIFAFVLLIFNFSKVFLYSEPIQNLQIDFERFYESENQKETIEGTIYYQSPEKIIIFVRTPVNQWMILKKKGMQIYYPFERKAFDIISKNTFSLPFFQAFWGVIRRDYGLIDMRYSIFSRETKEDTVITYWTPPKKLSKDLGTFTLKYISHKLIYAESKRADGTVMSKTFYSGHIENDSIFFPLEICKTSYSKADSTIEKIVYHNPQFNSNLPDDVVNFSIPPGVKVKKIEW